MSYDSGSNYKYPKQLTNDEKEELRMGRIARGEKPIQKNPALPKGFKIYTCTDCKEVNVKKDNGEKRVGFCDKCNHPLWNE